MKTKKGGSSEKVLPKKGNEILVISQVIDWGSVKDTFGVRRKVEFVMELPNQTHVFDEDEGEMPLVVDRKFANKLGTVKRPSGLREFIEAITGEDIPAEADEDGYELESLHGFAFRALIALQPDGEYTNVVLKSYAPLSPAEKKEYKKYKIQGPSIILDLDNFDAEVFAELPEWKQNEIKKSEEYKALGLKESKTGKVRDEEEEEEEEEEEDERPVRGAKKPVKQVQKGKPTGRKLI